MMWSGDPQYSQWALNPSTYQNVAHEEVDWAALAQQWIQMKETHPSDQIPPAPPPPAIGEKSDSGDKKKDSELEGGEAPMDMDTKEDNSNSSNTQSGDANTWNTWPNWQQWGWNWSATGGMVPPGGVPPPNQTLVQGKGTTSTSAMTVPPYSYPHNSQAYTSGTGVYDYNHAGGSDQYSQVMASGYWTSGGPADTGGVPPGPGPSPFIRHNRHDWRRNNRSHDRLRTSEKSDDEEDTTTVLDAAKRRQLPAWIREGLEKMEREKQKKIDRERQIKEREAYLQKKREDEEHAMNELEKNAGQPMIPKKSKFESDSEESGRGDSPTPSQSSLKRKSRFRNADSPNSSPRHPAARFPSTEPEPVKSREEQMQEVMLKVRRTLTEILLEVTTEEMETVAHEVLSRAKAKAPAMQLRKTQALASLTGKLGLGMYGDSEDSDSGDDGPGENSPGRANGADSDEELRDMIQRRKIDFIKTEREIEARIQEEEEREKERERRLMGEESDESDGEERQVENQTDTKHLVQKGSEEDDDDKKLKILHLQDNVKHEDKLQNSTIRDHFTTPPSVRKSDIKLERTEKLDRKSLNQKKSSVSSDENDDSSSKSNSYSSSSSDSSSSSRSSSSTSRRSSKKSSKSSRSMGGSRRSDRKKSSAGRRKHSRSLSRDSEDFKKSDKHRDRKRDSDKDRRGRDKRDRRRSRSRSMSDASRSRDGHDRRKSKDRRHSSRHESDSGSRKSRDSDRRSSNSSNKPRAYRHDRESPSPSRKSKKISRDKRRSRRSSGSSSPSSSKRRDSHRGEKRGRYSRSRSNSISSSKKSRRRRRSSSSSRSTQSFERSLGKKSGHSRND